MCKFGPGEKTGPLSGRHSLRRKEKGGREKCADSETVRKRGRIDSSLGKRGRSVSEEEKKGHMRGGRVSRVSTEKKKKGRTAKPFRSIFVRGQKRVGTDLFM